MKERFLMRMRMKIKIVILTNFPNWSPQAIYRPSTPIYSTLPSIAPIYDIGPRLETVSKSIKLILCPGKDIFMPWCIVTRRTSRVQQFWHTGCPTIEFSPCFACFLGFPCSYRVSFYHFSTALKTTIPKLTLLSSLRQKFIKLQSKMWGKLDLDIIILVHTRFI